MSELYLVRVPIKQRLFWEWGLNHGYISSPPAGGHGEPRDLDLGYALHVVLTNLFGEQSPRPFLPPVTGYGANFHYQQRNMDRGDIQKSQLDVLGYSRVGHRHLRTLAQLADPQFSNLIEWDYFQSRALPNIWPKNLRLRFDLRACPVRRRLVKSPLVIESYVPGIPSKTLNDKRRDELDAYQFAVARAAERGDGKPIRDEVYIEWLKQRLSIDNNASLCVSVVPMSIRVISYRSTRLLRRPRSKNNIRSEHWLTRPEVFFTGLLDIVEGSHVSDFLSRGVGRHCGFGFGMMLLKPA